MPSRSLGVAGQRLAVVELELLEQRQVGLLGLLQAGEHGPHGGHLQGVGRHVLAPHGVRAVVLLVDLDLLRQLGDVRDVDLHRAVPEGLHVLVVLQAAVFRLVGVPEDHLVDVGLRELLRLDLVFLAGPQQVVEERHVQLEDLHELDEPAIGDVELAVEIERSRVRLAAVLGDLPVVDVPRQLGGVLVLLILGLEGPDPDAVLLRQDQAADLEVPGDLLPASVVVLQQLREVHAAGRAEVAADVQAILRRKILVDLRQELIPDGGGNDVQRLLMHGAGCLPLVGSDLPVAQLLRQLPGEGVESALGRGRVLLQASLQQASDGGLGGSHRPVQQDDALLRSVAPGGALVPVVEEVVVDDALLDVDVFGGPLVEDHVVDALEGVPADFGIVLDDLEVLLEGALPVPFPESLRVVQAADPAYERGGLGGFGLLRHGGICLLK